MASYFGSALVALFMLLVYGKFGLFANIAVAINVAMIFGVLSLLNATLTLPGIIGIVLTVGIAVDSNVLIYERIREEIRSGRTAISAIDAGFYARACDDPRFQHHDLHGGCGAVLHRHRTGAWLRRDARHRHHHDGIHRVHIDPADGRVLGALGAPAAPRHFIDGISRAPLHAIPLLRIVPDDTKFDFMRFRRISFPISAILSIAAIALFFFHRSEFRHRFHRRHLDRGAVEVGSRRPRPRCARRSADSASARCSCSNSVHRHDVLIRVAQQPGGEQAQQAAVDKVERRSATGSSTGASRWSGRACRAELLAVQHDRLGASRSSAS